MTLKKPDERQRCSYLESDCQPGEHCSDNGQGCSCKVRLGPILRCDDKTEYKGPEESAAHHSTSQLGNMKTLSLLVLLAVLCAISLHPAGAEEALRGEDDSKSDLTAPQMQELEGALQELADSKSDPESPPGEQVQKRFFSLLANLVGKGISRLVNGRRKREIPILREEETE
uniref:haloacid dehalogenase-like hydrolase domain-containing protein 3 isoform X2 n=1 Tax=Pristiophorus japonicus TaxID=55135 RepID=UPI00398F2533